MILVGGFAARSTAETQALSDKLGRVIHVEIQGVKDGTVEVVRDDGRRFTIPFADLSSESQEEVRKWHARQNDPYREIDERVRPGERFFLSFPELADRNGGTPPRAGVSVPGDYHPEKPVPLLLWFGGGKGSSNPDGARGLVDPDAFVIFGENSRARNWQMTFNKRIEDSRAEVEFVEVPGAGHGLNRDGRKKIREWIETVAVPGLREE
jgi:hypothetical protein